MQIVAPRGTPGLHKVTASNRYGDSDELAAEEGIGYGLKLFSNTKASLVFPTDVYVDQETGVALTSGGYFRDGNSVQIYQGNVLPESTRAASFDIQDPYNPILVGGAPSLPSGPDADDQLGQLVLQLALTAKKEAAEAGYGPPLTPEEKETLENIALAELPLSLDSIRIQPVVEEEEGVLRKRLYVASGNGGVARLNLDEQNGLQYINSLFNGGGGQVTNLYRSGNALFANLASGKGTKLNDPCAHTAVLAGTEGSIRVGNYIDVNDPIDLGGENLSGSYSLHFADGWLYSGGIYTNHFWKPEGLCMFYMAMTADRGSDLGVGEDDPDTAVMTAKNLFDPALTQDYYFDNNIMDIIDYGDHLIVALAKSGVVIFHKERPDNKIFLKADNNVQTVPSRPVKLHIAGSTLFVSGGHGGLQVYDLSDINAPKLVSAGNIENAEALDIYKDRVVVGGGDNGLSLLQLPGALVIQSSVSEKQIIAQEERIEIRFNEAMNILEFDNLQAVKVTKELDGSNVNFTLTAKDEINGFAETFDLSFAREFGVSYKIEVVDGRNKRGGHLWTGFTRHVIASNTDFKKPVIQFVDNGAFYRGANEVITVKGNGFSSSAQVYLDQYPVNANWIDEQTITIDTSTINLLPLETGQHHLRIVQGDLEASYLGAVLIGDEFQNVEFELANESGSMKGGGFNFVTAKQSVILPGTKVLLRSKSGNEIFTEVADQGNYIVNLKDDVQNLKKFRFRMPGVIQPELYDVYLIIKGQEYHAGQYSYLMEQGRGIDLPNYPPMVIGDSKERDGHLFIGVKAGKEANANNRFLMQHGLEIYDINIWDNPLRLSQLRSDQPVTGVELIDNLAYLANGSNGLTIVDIQDLKTPYVIRELPVSGYDANDVAAHSQKGILALAASSDLKDGFVRFFNLSDEELGQPQGYNTIVFNQGALEGQPIKLQWLSDNLYVLFNRDGQLYLAIFDSFGTNLSYRVQAIERGLLDGNLNSADLHVQHGQISVTTGSEYLVLQANINGDFETVYWQQLDNNGGALTTNGGGLFISDTGGLTNTASPSLVVSGLVPANGSEITIAEPINIFFNKLINTTEADVRASISLTDDQGVAIDPSLYQVVATNTLTGAVVEIQFIDNASTPYGSIQLQVTTGIKALNGSSLLAPVNASYQLISGIKPEIVKVTRKTTANIESNYFHGDGSEVAIVHGANFGSDASNLVIQLGRSGN